MRWIAIGIMLCFAVATVAAVSMRGGSLPNDATFSYQGQLRAGGQPVNGAVDLRVSLWDEGVGGNRVGEPNTFNAYPVSDGKFALGLNFGFAAFAGDQRWLEVEFRFPSGVGPYVLLNPRDKINATPYALFAANGGTSEWIFDPVAHSLVTSKSVTKVGIGTTTPSAALEVVAAGGDDSVRLPAGSIGVHEIAARYAAAGLLDVSSSSPGPESRVFDVAIDGVLVLDGVTQHIVGAGVCDLYLDGVHFYSLPSQFGEYPFRAVVPITAGTHALELRVSQGGPIVYAVRAIVLNMRDSIEFRQN